MLVNDIFKRAKVDVSGFATTISTNTIIAFKIVLSLTAQIRKI